MIVGLQAVSVSVKQTKTDTETERTRELENGETKRFGVIESRSLFLFPGRLGRVCRCIAGHQKTYRQAEEHQDEGCEKCIPDGIA
jgi:hypothetical protein